MTDWYQPEPQSGQPRYGPPGSPAAGDGGEYLPGSGGDDAGPGGGWLGGGSGAATAPYPVPAPARRGRLPERRPPRRRTPLLAGVAVLLAAAVAVTAVAARHYAGHTLRPAAAASSARPHASQPAAPAAVPAITRAAARKLVTSYIAANNDANKNRSTAALARIEGGSSYQLDAGGYQFLTASDPANTSYQAFSFSPAAWYIPRLAGYPRWFAVYGTWTGTRSGSYRGYLLFARPGPGARWRQVLAPNLTGAATVPTPATSADGYAEAASAGSGAGLAAATAARLDGTAAGPSVTGVQPLADQQDQAFWAARVPRGTGDTDRHAVTPYGVYALRTVGGGALVFYGLTATLTVVPPPGLPVTLKIPGYYSPAEPVTTAAAVPYADQFAAWVGARGARAGIRVIAENSGIAVRA